jgi:nucleoside 2-deoxyribosyltransferase
MNDQENQIQVFISYPHTQKSSQLMEILASDLREQGVKVSSVEDISAGASWVEYIKTAIEQANFIIADLSDSNPNVMYEVGYAHAMRKPVLPIVQASTQDIPFNLSGYQYVVYDANDPGSLRQRVQNWTATYLNNIQRGSSVANG